MPVFTDFPLPPCPLCAGLECRLFHRDTRRHYVRCSRCALVFVPTAEHLSPADEKAQYDLHDNRIDDPRYRAFLMRLATPALQRTHPGAQGLDVGCGPVPLLVQILEEVGVAMRRYDPVYWPDASALLQCYDLVTATEVVEHFRAPGREFARLFALLRSGGVLAVMTKRVRDAGAFAQWHYILDPTHVAFYAEETFAWLAEQYRARLEIVGDDVVVFTAAVHENAPMISPESP